MSLITGLVLAGGRGTRMGEIDKGLQLFRGMPMVEHVLQRLAPQVNELLINANRNIACYRAFGYPVVADSIDGFAGPLAGLYAGMQAATHSLIVTAPCDSPFLPANLVIRMHAALTAQQADVAVAKTGSQVHPVFCLTRCDLAPHLQQFLASGQRKIDKWYATLTTAEVAFDGEETAFANINTIQELESLEKRSD